MRRQRLPLDARLFLTCWLVFGLHFATNIVREHYPAFSLAERGTLRVDPYLGLHPDLFAVEGRGAFINNNPGASLLGGLAYAPVRPLVDLVVARVDRARAARGAPLTSDYDTPHPNRRKFFAQVRERGLDVRFGLASLATHALGMAPLSAAAVVAMRRVLRRAGASAAASLALALVYAFGTPVFFRTGYLSHNLIAAHAALFSFALLWRPDRLASEPPRLAAAGACAGAALLCDYSGIVPLAALGSWTAVALLRALPARSALARLAAFGAGAALPIGILLGYQAWAFGSPFYPAQHYMPATELSVRGWNGLAWPAPDLMAANLFDPRYGLFSFGPILLLACAVPLARRSGLRLGASTWALAYGVFAGMLLFTSANQFARLQWNTGFRMLAPVLPFLFLPAAAALAGLPRALALGLGALAILHSWCLAMVREDAWGSVAQVLAHGPTLPWLTVLWRMGEQYLPLLQRTGPQGLPFLALAGILLAALWWPRREPATPREARA